MIRLERSNAPVELTTEAAIAYSEQFQRDGTIVWDKLWLKRALLAFSFSKCAYCECLLGEESKYMEVEHFIAKDLAPDQVMNWDNLLPSCRRCNGNKATHDVRIEPIIDPTVTEPKDHLALGSPLRLAYKTTLGRTTIDVLYLNDSERLVYPRFKITEALLKGLVDLRSQTEEYVAENVIRPRKRTRLIAGVENILAKATAKSVYCAVIATYLQQSNDWSILKRLLRDNDMWTIELENLDQDMVRYVLDII